MQPSIALVGFGKIGHRHANILANLEKATFAAICDIDSAAQADARTNYPAQQVYPEFGQILENKEIEILDIATPNYLHAEMAIKGLESGKHVIVEKPMALTPDDCAEMIAASEKNGKKLFVVKQNRYNPAIQAVRRAIESGKLDKLFMADVRVPWHRPAEYYSDSPWKGSEAKDGGALFTQASHFIDLLHWIMGDVTSVFARMDTYSHDIESEDTGSLLITFANGAMANFSYSTCVYNKNYDTTMSFWGLNGSIILGGPAADRIDFWDIEGLEKPDLQKQDSSCNEYGTYRGSSAHHNKLLPDIIDVILGEQRKYVVDGRIGKKSVDIIYAAKESAKSGKAIKL